MSRNVKTLLCGSFVAVGLASPALAVDVWTGNRIGDIAAHHAEIIMQCDGITGAGGFTAGFLNTVQTQDAALRNQIQTMIMRIPAIVAERNIERARQLATQEAARVVVQISCTRANGITLAARTGGGAFQNLLHQNVPAAPAAAAPGGQAAPPD
jgi:hypothetical protein